MGTVKLTSATVLTPCLLGNHSKKENGRGKQLLKPTSHTSLNSCQILLHSSSFDFVYKFKLENINYCHIMCAKFGKINSSFPTKFIKIFHF